MPRPGAPVGQLYGHLWRFAKGARLRLLAAATLLFSSQLLKLVIPFLAGQAINAIQAGGPRMLIDAGAYIGTLFAVFAGSWLLHGPGRIIERSVGVQVRTNVADALYGRAVRLPLAWHNQHHSGAVLHRVDQASRALYDFAQTQFIYLQNFVNIAGPVIALALLSSTLGWTAGAGFLIVGAVIVRFDRRLMHLAAEENTAERYYSAGLLDFLGNVSTVISLRLQQPTRELLKRRLAAVFVPLRKSIVVNEFKWCAVDLLTVGLTWSLVALFAWSTFGSTGALALGSLFMVYQYAQQAGGVIGSLATHFQSFTRIATNYASADVIWDAAEQPERPPTLQRANTGAVQVLDGGRSNDGERTAGGGNGDGRDADWREIAAVGLDFDYVRQDGTRPALRGVSLLLRRGGRIALVGSSGSGKSSLLRVLAGLYQPTRGHYLVDDLAQVGLRDLSRWATLIPQEYDVFEGTVRENLTFGAPASDIAIAQALEISAFDGVVDALPQALETPITERGFNLSGGQRQRLALARGLLAAAGRPILLLDEPTSALDQGTEALVLDRIFAAWSDGTVITSVHRMALLQKFDRVVYMADGRVIDVGTPDELNARQPLFRDLLRQTSASQRELELRAG